MIHVRRLSATVALLPVLLGLTLSPHLARSGTIVAQTAPLQTLHIGVLPNDDMTSVLYAQQSGMFREAGIDVRIDHSSSNGSAIAAAVAAGSYDIGKSSITPIFDAHLHGLPFTIVASAAIYDSRKPYVGFLVPVDSSLHAASQLTGPVAVSFIHDLGQLAIDKAIDEAGGDWHAAQFIELPMSASSAAVESSRVQAGEISYPPAQASIESGKVRLIPAYDTFGKQFIFSVWFTTNDFATKHRELVTTFARVVANAARYTNSHPQETVAMVAAFTGVPQDIIARMPRVQNGTSVYASGIQPLIDTEAKYGFIARSFSATDIIDPDVLAK